MEKVCRMRPVEVSRRKREDLEEPMTRVPAGAEEGRDGEGCRQLRRNGPILTVERDFSGDWGSRRLQLGCESRRGVTHIVIAPGNQILTEWVAPHWVPNWHCQWRSRQ